MINTLILSLALLLLGRRQEQVRPAILNNTSTFAGDCKANDDRYDDDVTKTPTAVLRAGTQVLSGDLS